MIWVFGFEVGPDLHLALHDVVAPHVHGHGHARAHARDHEHDHTHRHDAAHEHVASVWSPARARAAMQVLRRDRTTDKARASDHRAGAVARVLDPQHGRHAAAHRGIAVLVSSPPVPQIFAAAWRPIPQSHTPSASRDARAPDVLRARGPPRVIEAATAV